MYLIKESPNVNILHNYSTVIKIRKLSQRHQYYLICKLLVFHQLCTNALCLVSESRRKFYCSFHGSFEFGQACGFFLFLIRLQFSKSFSFSKISQLWTCLMTSWLRVFWQEYHKVILCPSQYIISGRARRDSAALLTLPSVLT